MKYPHTRLLLSLAVGTLLTAGLPSAFAQTGKPTVITPPAVKDGSNWSRAPFPAQRQSDDVTPPDGKAIDATGANSPVANIEPPVPASRIAVLQPATPAVVGSEPALMPTGRSTVAIATPLDAQTFTPSIRSLTFESREQTLADIDARLKASEKAMSSVHSTTSQMSADSRQQFNAAADEVKAKAHALRQDLKNARKANTAQWEATREQLAADYEAYAAAVARVDAATGAMTR